MVLLLCFSFFCLVITAVELPKVLWEQGYSNGDCEAHPHAGVELSIGGFFLVGDSVCWNQPDSPLKRSIFAVRTSPDGTLVWSHQLGQLGHNYGKFALELSDGSLLVAGSVSIEATGKAKKQGIPYLERRGYFRLDVSTGRILSNHTLAGPGDKPGAEATVRDGFMAVVEVTGIYQPQDEIQVIFTGYLGGESGYNTTSKTYDDEPMFFIYGGYAFLTKLTLPLSIYAGHQGPVIDDDVTFDKLNGIVAMQGMRLHAVNSTVLLSCVTHLPNDGNLQFGAILYELGQQKLKWARMYTASNASQSHPFAFAASPSSDSVVLAGHAIESRSRKLRQHELSAPQDMPVGRVVMLEFATGDVRWEARFSNEEKDANTECYGVAFVASYGGLAVTCGTGVEPEDHPLDPPKAKTWRVLTAAVSEQGELLWQGLFTDNAALQNNAGEYILATRAGGAAVLVDSQSWGTPGTGGNFGLQLLAPLKGERIVSLQVAQPYMLYKVP